MPTTERGNSMWVKPYENLWLPKPAGMQKAGPLQTALRQLQGPTEWVGPTGIEPMTFTV